MIKYVRYWKEGVVNFDCKVGNGFREERKFELVVWEFCRGKVGIEVFGKRSMGVYSVLGIWF